MRVAARWFLCLLVSYGTLATVLRLSSFFARLRHPLHAFAAKPTTRRYKMALLPRTAALLTTVTQCRGLSQRAGARYLLVDGHNLIYRAFYAMPQLSRSGDRPVGAVMGVANTFLKLALPYSRVVFCLDPKGPGWREELFATAWKSTGELGYCKRPCQPSRHRADAVTWKTPRRWRGNRRSDGNNIAPTRA